MYRSGADPVLPPAPWPLATSKMLAMPNSASPRPTSGMSTDFAGGRLDQDVQSGLLLQHLGDRRSRRVVERTRLHGGKAEGLSCGEAST